MALLPKRPEIYADFRRDFDLSPANSDLARKTNEESVKEAMTNLILSDKGEWLMDPRKGAGVGRFIFKNITPVTLVQIKNHVRAAITNYERRVDLVDVDVTGNLNGNSVTISVYFRLNNNDKVQSLEVIVDRVR